MMNSRGFPMPPRPIVGETTEYLNGYKTESAANTMTYEVLEVPNSAGAKRVFVEDMAVDLSDPDVVASTQTKVQGIIIRGKPESAPSSGTYAQTGAIMASESICHSDATPLPILLVQAAPRDREGPFEVFKYRDGKFYVCVAVKGTNNTGTKSIFYHIEFTVER